MPEDVSGEALWRRTRITVPVPQPAAGAGWTFVVPAGHVYHLHSVLATLQTSAAVANRSARIQLGDGVRTFLDLPPAAVQPASVTWVYAWTESPPALQIGTGVSSHLPHTAMPAGWTVGTLTNFLDVADQWSGIVLGVTDVWSRRGDIDLDAMPELVVQLVEPNAT